MKDYEDIIRLPRHVSSVHPPMAAAARAAQFLPFAALAGFEEAIRETERLAEEKLEPCGDGGSGFEEYPDC